MKRNFTIFTLILGGIFLLTNSAMAIIPFGGRIGPIIFCTNGLLITLVSPPGPPGPFLFQWGLSMLYSWYLLLPSNAVLGRAIPGGTCNLVVTDIPAFGTILQVGTSAK